METGSIWKQGRRTPPFTANPTPSATTVPSPYVLVSSEHGSRCEPDGDHRALTRERALRTVSRGLMPFAICYEHAFASSFTFEASAAIHPHAALSQRARWQCKSIELYYCVLLNAEPALIHRIGTRAGIPNRHGGIVPPPHFILVYSLSINNIVRKP